MGAWDEQFPLWHVAAGISEAFGGTPLHDGGAPHCDPFGTGVLHTPPKQVSRVHGFPSTLQPEPLARAVWTHPLAATHESVVQLSASLQFSAGPAWQTPLKHWSAFVQRLLSALHDVPVTGLA